MLVYTVLLIIGVALSITGAVILLYGLASGEDYICGVLIGTVIIIIQIALLMITWAVVCAISIDDNTNEILPEYDELTPTLYEYVNSDTYIIPYNARNEILYRRGIDYYHDK